MEQLRKETTEHGINRMALFTDGTCNYRMPTEPMEGDTVMFRFRVAKNNVGQVNLCINGEVLCMEKRNADVLFDYYEQSYCLQKRLNDYYFEILKGEERCYYTSIGVMDEPGEEYWFQMMAGFETPDWAKGAVIYQIFVDRFFNGDTGNDVLNNEYYYINEPVKEVNTWTKYPDVNGVGEFYGGDLLGIIKKLDYLKELGIEVIYLNPIFVSPSNHKYDIQDYDYVDPHFGRIVQEAGEVLAQGETNNQYATKYIQRVASFDNLEASNQLFIELVEEIHKRGMKIILDGVFNHCGSFNKWLDRERIYESLKNYEKGAYVDETSPYHDFFTFYGDTWPYNENYDGWWGHATLPKLNYEGSNRLYEYILNIARKWVSPPFCVDGWRLDVAADLGHSNEFNHQFWRDFRKIIKEANPDALILAEHYGDPSGWLKGDEWDSIMNYDAFMEPVTWFLTGMEKHSDEYREDYYGNAEHFFGAMKHFMSRFQTPSLLTAMNELSNHDHSRFLTRTNRQVGRIQTRGCEVANQGVSFGVMKEAMVIQLTWPGAPTIYYGDEAGVCGWTDPDNRRTYPWGSENEELIMVYRELIRIHKSYDALRIGSVKFLYGQKHVLAYGRFDFIDKFIVVVNNNMESVTVTVNAWEIGLLDTNCMVRLIETNEHTHYLDACIYTIEDGKVTLEVPPITAIVMKNHVEFQG